MTHEPTPPSIEHLCALLATFIKEMRSATDTVPVVVAPDTNLLADIGLDSLEITEIVYRLEDTLGIQLDLERIQLGHFQSMHELAGLVRESSQ